MQNKTYGQSPLIKFLEIIERQRLLKEFWHNVAVTSNNALKRRKPASKDISAQWEQMEIIPIDADLKLMEQLEIDRQNICASFNGPVSLLGSNENSESSEISDRVLHDLEIKFKNLFFLGY